MARLNMFKEYGIFRLLKPIGDESIPVGKIGVVLMVYQDPSIAYDVEFVDENGRNLGSAPTFTLTEDYMERVQGTDEQS
jgi:hypothetical protein